MTGALAGRHIVNTRPLARAATLDRLLIEQGAVPVSYPCIANAPPFETRPLEEALRDLSMGAFDWIVFTSANAVEALREAGLTGMLDEVSIAAIGPSTGQAVQELLGRDPDFIPERHDSATLASTLPAGPQNRVLAPSSAIARPDLRLGLEARGIDVHVVDAYRTVTGSGGDDLPLLLQHGTIDAFTFSSPSAVDGLLQRLGQAGIAAGGISNIPAACLGDTTARAADDLGMLTIRSETQEMSGLVATLIEHFSPIAVGGRT
ncbi:MAG: uroporphyrinogen-III synthase [Thermomicrobiales bacterium]|nr:uroporphyrinogen-III synthase [Thermomicrobiales bacterium]